VLQQHAVFDIVKNFTADYDKPLIFDKVTKFKRLPTAYGSPPMTLHVFKLRIVNTFTFLRVNVVFIISNHISFSKNKVD
jgi:hypothetical protein